MIRIAPITALVLATLGAAAALGCGTPDTMMLEPTYVGGAGGGAKPNEPFAQGQTPATVSPMNACAGATMGATTVPLYIVVALDRSESMADDGKWQAAMTGMSAFFEAPHTNVNASLALFPQKDSTCTGDFVLPSVPMEALPSASFRTKLAGTKLMHGTPMRPALEGAVDYAVSLQKQLGASARVVVALVTDGKPTENLCGGNTVSDVVNIAANAWLQHGLFTYAVGMPGALQGNLDLIAGAGGTNVGALLSATNPATELTQALDGIRGAFACEVALPASDPAKPYSTDEVNVRFNAASGAVTVPYSNGCASGDGWRYDDAAKPTRIVLCPSTCAQGKASMAQIQVQLGCPTEGDEPR